MDNSNPFLGRESEKPPDHIEGDFKFHEVQLANRNSGIPLEALHYDPTPLGMHYLLTHFDIPVVDKSSFRLEVHQEVPEIGSEPLSHLLPDFRRPGVRTLLSLSLDQIKRLPEKKLHVTLECAGNGRALMRPRWLGMPWINKGVSTACWTGTSVKQVIEMAQPDPCEEVSFFGLDRGLDRDENGEDVEHRYGRSLKIKEISEDVLLVYKMNDRELSPQHGYPIRLLVPGSYGMASVKWLSDICLLAKPFIGPQQTGYWYRKDEKDSGNAVTIMRVRALMIPPGIPYYRTRRRLVEAGSVKLSGRAWTGGGGEVTRVAVKAKRLDVAIDGGWQDATLLPSSHRYAWREWSFEWNATPGQYELTCRATDARDDQQNEQKEKPVWNWTGMENNAVQKVEVTVG